MNKYKELQEFADRLNQICDEKGIPGKGHGRQLAFAKHFGVSQKGARKWLEGETYPTWERLADIAKWGNITIDWLITGREPKRPLGLNEPQAMYLSSAEKKLIENLRHCQDVDVQAIERIAQLSANAQSTRPNTD